METQINYLGNQMNAMLNAMDFLRRLQAEQSRVPTTGVRTMRVNSVPAPANSSPVSSMRPRTSKPVVGEAATKNPIMLTEGPGPPVPDAERKPAQVQLRGPHGSSSALLSTKTILMTNTLDQGVKPITVDSSDTDLFSTKATLGSETDDAVYVAAQTMLSGPSSLYFTADDGVPVGDACASSTRRTIMWLPKLYHLCS